jgi:hypothetical protein
MKLIFPEETNVNVDINIDSLTKLVYKKNFNYINNYIKKVKMVNLINSENTHLAPGKEINEFYVIRIELKFPGLPLEFLKRLDNYIEFPVLYILQYKDFRNLVLPVNLKIKNKQELLRVFYSGWFENEGLAFCVIDEKVKTIDDAYKNIMNFLCGMDKENDFDYSIADYIDTLNQNIKDIYSTSLAKELNESKYVFIHNFGKFDIGANTFNSVREIFSCYNKQNFFFDVNKKILKYLFKINYDNFNLSFTFDRKIKDNLFVSYIYLSNLSIGNSSEKYYKNEYDVSIQKEQKEDTNSDFISTKYKGIDYAYVVKPLRTRSDDEIKEMELIYGKYLIEKNDNENKVSNKKVKQKEKLTKTAKKNKNYRRKLTPEDIEELKKYSSKKIY